MATAKDKEIKIVALPGGITEAQLAAWKKEHNYKEQGDVFTVEVDVNGDGKDIKTAWFHKPGLDEFGRATTLATKDDFMGAGNVLFESTYLGGDPEVRNNPEYKASCFATLLQRFKIRKAVVKNW
ncbi:hypothetical protein BH09BAC1_BH09BAC1_04980 [soil metagenome]